MATPRKRTAAPAAKPENVVDDTVKNQENLGSAPVVDRSPEPQLVEDPTTGATYDVSKSSPELVDPDAEETAARRARLRQTEAVLDAKNIEGEDDLEETPKIEVQFLESGLTIYGKVWKAGEVLEIEDSEAGTAQHKDLNGDAWYELSSSQQKERYGKVFFEKR